MRVLCTAVILLMLVSRGDSLQHVWRALASLLLGILFWPGGGHAQPLSPGTKLPSIESSLQQIDGSAVSVGDLLGEQGTVFLFWSTQCPWVSRYEERIQSLAQSFRPSGIQFVLVNVEDATSDDQESLQARREREAQRDSQGPYVHDPNAAFARALGAERTPHAFLFDAQRTLIYEGAIDDSPSDPDRVQKTYLRDALSALLEGEPPDVRSTKAFGCTLKYPE